MRSREAARDGVRHVFWLAALFELERPVCVCDLRVYRCDSMLLVARLLLVLPSTMEPAHDLRVAVSPWTPLCRQRPETYWYGAGLQLCAAFF